MHLAPKVWCLHLKWGQKVTLGARPGDNNLYAQGHASSTLIHFMANVVRKGSTYYAPKGSYYEGNVRIDGDFIVPARTHFWGRLVVTGRLELGMKSSVAFDVECGSAIIGSHARVKGPLVATGDVTLLDHFIFILGCHRREGYPQARRPGRRR